MTFQFLKSSPWDGEKAEWLRVMATMSEELGPIPSTHITGDSQPSATPDPEDTMPSLASEGTGHARGIQTDTQTGTTYHTHKVK